MDRNADNLVGNTVSYSEDNTETAAGENDPEPISDDTGALDKDDDKEFKPMVLLGDE